MSQTSKEIRAAWDKENLKRYQVSFHRSNNADMIKYIESRKANGETTSEIFRAAIGYLMEHEPLK